MPTYTLKISWKRLVPRGNDTDRGVMTETVTAPDLRQATIKAARSFRIAYEDVLEATAIRQQETEPGLF